MKVTSLRSWIARHRIWGVGALAAAIAIGGTAAYGYFAAHGTEQGTAQVVDGPGEGIAVQGSTDVTLPVDVTVPLSGMLYNRHNMTFAVTRIKVSIDSMHGGAAGTCSTENGVDFVIEDAVPATPIAVPAASGPGSAGMAPWSGASITFRTAPDHAQNGCLGKTLVLKYEIAND